MSGLRQILRRDKVKEELQGLQRRLGEFDQAFTVRSSFHLILVASHRS